MTRKLAAAALAAAVLATAGCGGTATQTDSSTTQTTTAATASAPVHHVHHRRHCATHGGCGGFPGTLGNTWNDAKFDCSTEFFGGVSEETAVRAWRQMVFAYAADAAEAGCRAGWERAKAPRATDP